MDDAPRRPASPSKGSRSRIPIPLALTLALHLSAALTVPATAAAQSGDAALAAELTMHFESSMAKFIGLAEAMPSASYTWSPGEGVMEVGRVFMHVARYNYMYPSQNMGVPAPAGVDLDGMEAVRDKAAVLRALNESRAYVLETVGSMTPAELAASTRLYGRDVARWAVLVQLVAHMNEHLGQSIAYARMNDIVPPWSR
jgi:uncharacterized damage-inducible protein DinB